MIVYPVILALKQFYRRVFLVVGNLSWGLEVNSNKPFRRTLCQAN